MEREIFSLLVDGQYIECELKDSFFGDNGVGYAALIPANGEKQLYYCRYDESDFGDGYILIENESELDYVEQRYMKVVEMKLVADELAEYIPEEAIEAEGIIEEEPQTVTVKHLGQEVECNVLCIFKSYKERNYAALSPVDKASCTWSWELFRYEQLIFGIECIKPIKNESEYQRVRADFMEFARLNEIEY